jgi:predicted membrane protein
MPGPEGALSLESVVHIIQVSLTPIFLLSGIATLLNVFSTRFARVADQVDALRKAMDDGDVEAGATLSRRLSRLHRRSLALDTAVILGAVAGAATCATVLALFLGEAKAFDVASLLFGTFGIAIVCTIGAIAAFAVEMVLANRLVRSQAATSRIADSPPDKKPARRRTPGKAPNAP